MKTLLRFTMLFILLSLICGCAAPGGRPLESRTPPPDSMTRVFLRYKELPGEKVFVVAVDRDGRWAYGYDYNRASAEEAALSASSKCDAMRKKRNIFTRAKMKSLISIVPW